MAMAAVCRIRLARSLASSALHALFSIRTISSRSQLPTFTRNEVLYVQRCRENSWKQPGQGRYFSSTESVAHIVLSMPALSPTMNQGNIVKWRKKQGEKIEVGDVLCEIETDKATLEYESLEEGYLAKILVPEGSKDVLVGQPIAVTVEEEGDIEKVPDVAGTAETQPMQDVSTVTIKHEADQKSSFNRIGPAAKLLIHSHGLDASSLKASGPRSTLLKGDVLAAIKSGLGSSTAAAPSQHQKSSGRQSSDPQLASALKSPIDTDSQLAPVSEDLPNSQIRKIIARRLLESKMTTPHTYLSSDAILDHLVAFRQELKEKNGVKVSVNDLIVKAVAVTLRAVPEANAYWDLEKEEVALCDSIDISIAVATEKGLMTPIIRNADQKSLTAISTEIKELAEKARAGKLAPHEFQGGTFSISNLGMFPVDHFCAIINPPQACILAVGQTTKVVEPVTNADGMETIVAVSKMKFTVSADHRVIDGRIGGAFLTTLSSNLSDVKRLIL